MCACVGETAEQRAGGLQMICKELLKTLPALSSTQTHAQQTLREAPWHSGEYKVTVGPWPQGRMENHDMVLVLSEKSEKIIHQYVIV